MRVKLRVLFVIITVIFISLLSNDASAAKLAGKNLYIKNNVSVVIDGKKVQFQAPILNKSGELLLPMRSFYEAIGASVTWDKQSLTAGATRNEKTVNLTINSKAAKVNGANVSMNVAPLLYKYNTYIPLRFVSENLDGKVLWNQEAQRVDIVLDGSTPNIPSPPTPTPSPIPKDSFILHINNERIEMTDPIITKDYRTYIPADYFSNHIENGVGKWVNAQNYELQIAEQNFVFSNGNNNVILNGEDLSIDGKPFIQNGKMYVPVNFIVNTLGGNLRYLSDKKEMYVYLNNFMFKSAFLEKSYGSTAVPQFVSNVRLDGNRDLLVSDNPETLKAGLVPGFNATLAQYHVQSSSNTNQHRVFGWHHNKLGRPVTLGITVENTSSTPIVITNSKGASQKSGNSWIDYDIGLYIADAFLNDTLKNSSSTGIVIQPGETKTIESYELYNGYVIGFLHDFDIRSASGGSTDYIIRTVVSKNNADLNLIHSDAVPSDAEALHPRGAWAQSSIVAEFPTYTIGSPEIGFNISNGRTDHFLNANNSLSQINGSVGNPGHFGVNYKVVIPIINPTGEMKTVRLKLSGRGGLYSGAVKINGQVYLIPTLKHGTEYLELPEQTIEGYSNTINLEVMHAGGSNLPLAIYVQSN